MKFHQAIRQQFRLVLLILPISAAHEQMRMGGSNLHKLSKQEQLYQDLFREYERSVRPVEDSLEPTQVTVSPNLHSLIDVNENAETVVFSRWFQMFWKDPNLVWNSSEYGGLTDMVVDATKIWVPDITIIEQLRLTNANTLMDFASVTSDGSVRYSLNDIVEVYCHIDAADFPNDKQNCSTSYVSWEFTEDQIHLQSLYDDPREYIRYYGINSEWTLLSYTFEKIRINDNRSISFDAVRFWVAFERNPMYYTLSTAVPAFLITTLSLLGLFSPSHSTHVRQQRIIVGLQASMAMSVLLINLTNWMPKSQQFPKLGAYIVGQMVLSSVGAAVAVLVMHLHTQASLRLCATAPKKSVVRLSPTNDKTKTRLQQVDYDKKDALLAAELDSAQASPAFKSASNATNEHGVNELGSLQRQLAQVQENMKELSNILEEQLTRDDRVKQLAARFNLIDIALLVLFLTINSCFALFYYF